MQKEAIQAWAKEQMLPANDKHLETGYRYYHGLRVAKLSLELAAAESLGVNEELLFIGGLLHDVGKAGEGGKGHGPRGAEIIEAEIADLFTPDELRQVTSIVANHYMRPQSKYLRDQPDPHWPPEVLLVQDADTLDHFGANGIWIAHHWAAFEKRNQAASISRHWVEDQPWHAESRRAMNYQTASRELEHRIACMDAFIHQWEKEEQGQLSYRCSKS
jgi:putative nucleotidyltransferase with HDIG domain